jgi:hypothetical protein
MTLAPGKDDPSTTVAIGLLAYLSTDVAHHLLGHGVACLALGGKIHSLSSVFVDGTLTGATIDLAGPAANLVVGLTALALVAARRPFSRSFYLFLLLVAAFNLFWFELQLVFSAATKTDDWAWPIRYYGIPDLARYGMIVLGALGYWLTVRTIGARLGFPSRSRAKFAVTSAWIAAGAIACITAAFDHHPSAAILRHAAPQSLVLSIGLLFTPSVMPAYPADVQMNAVERSPYWIAAAVIASILSVLFLGPGFAISL